MSHMERNEFLSRNFFGRLGCCPRVTKDRDRETQRMFCSKGRDSKGGRARLTEAYGEEMDHILPQ